MGAGQHREREAERVRGEGWWRRASKPSATMTSHAEFEGKGARGGEERAQRGWRRQASARVGPWERGKGARESTRPNEERKRVMVCM